MRRIVGGMALLSGVAIPTLMIASGSASADGVTKCNRPFPPETQSYEARYEGNGHCTGEEVSSWRVQIGLAKEKVNWGPIPNDWEYQPGSYTTFTPWHASGATDNKVGYMSCYDLKDDWDYKARFRYETVWTDGHDTFGYYHSDDRKLC